MCPPQTEGFWIKGTAYQTDLGMTGPRQSVLGREIKPCVDRFLHGMPQKCPVAEGDVGLQGCIVEIGRCEHRKDHGFFEGSNYGSPNWRKINSFFPQ